MTEVIPIDHYSPEINEILALTIAVVAGAFLRLLRIQIGGILMLSSIFFLLLVKPGWEKGVFIFDLSIMNQNTFFLFLFFVACEWLVITLSPQLKELTGSIVDTFTNHKVAAILLPSLSPLAGTPRQGTSIVEECMQTKTPADRFVFVAWFRHLLTPIMPCLLFPVVLAFGLNISSKEVLIQIAPLCGIWLIAGFVLLRGFESMRIASHPNYMPLLKTLLLPLIVIVPCFYLSNNYIVLSLWVAVVLMLVGDKDARQLIWNKRSELQIVRWFLLAAGIAVWSWMFDHLLFYSGTPPTNGFSATEISDHNLQQLIASKVSAYKWAIVAALPFVVGLISGHTLLTAILVTPIALCTDLGMMALLPTVGAAFIGSVLSYEHIAHLKLQNQYHGTLKNIYAKLIIPVIIAAVLLAVISFR